MKRRLTQLYDGGATWEEVGAFVCDAGFALCDLERVFVDAPTEDLLQLDVHFRRQ